MLFFETKRISLEYCNGKFEEFYKFRKKLEKKIWDEQTICIIQWVNISSLLFP